MAFILLRSISMVHVSIFLLCALPLLSGCVLVAAANYATHDVECEALRSDHERGVVTTAWNQKKCDRIERERVEEAQRIVNEAEQQKIQTKSAPNSPQEQMNGVLAK
jgi:hypothetical protein